MLFSQHHSTVVSKHAEFRVNDVFYVSRHPNYSPLKFSACNMTIATALACTVAQLDQRAEWNSLVQSPAVLLYHNDPRQVVHTRVPPGSIDRLVKGGDALKLGR